MIILVNASKLTGKKIVGAGGNVLGEVEGVDVDLSTWQASGLYVSLTDDATAELRFKKPFLSKVVIILPTKYIASVGDVVPLKESVKNLKDLVEWVKEEQ